MACSDSTGRMKVLLLHYADGGLDPMTRNEVAEHLQTCVDCRLKIEEIRHFQALLTFIDKSTWGDKSECPPSEELVLLSESPAEIPPERIAYLKAHLAECILCNESLKKLININKLMKNPDFETQYPMPKGLGARLGRMVGERVRSSAASGGPVAITLENTLEFATPLACFESAGRKAPQGQQSVPVLAGEISGLVADEQGEPVRREKVSLFRNDTAVYRVRTSHLGGFCFRNLVQGFYEIRIRSTRMLVVVKRMGMG